MADLAPIALFVYNRPVHTRRVVEALQNNELAAGSDLYVFADAPKMAAQQGAVDEVRAFIRSIGGFKSVTLIERSENYGCARSIITGVTEIVNRFGRIIVIEDDILTSPHFLRFMNDALETYRHEERVISIHGYLYPVHTELPETFFIRGADIWGWGTWKRGWDLYEYDSRNLLKELRQRKLTRELDAYGYIQLLEEQIIGQVDTWDIQWYVSAYLNDRLTLYPGKSLVQNIGYDSSGTHCTTTNTYTVELNNSPVTVSKMAIREDDNARRAIGDFLISVKPKSGLRAHLVRKAKVLASGGSHVERQGTMKRRPE